MPRDQASLYCERRTQIASPLVSIEARLVGSRSNSPHVGKHRQPCHFLQWLAKLDRLVESTCCMPSPMQRHWQQRVDIFGQVRQCLHEYRAECRHIVEPTPKLHRLDRRINGKYVTQRCRGGNKWWRPLLAVCTVHAILQRCCYGYRASRAAMLDPGQLRRTTTTAVHLVGLARCTAEHTTARHDCRVECPAEGHR